MAEIISSIETFQGFLSGIKSLVDAILQAREDVRELPNDMKMLMKEANKVKNLTDMMIERMDDKQGLLKPQLQILGEELMRAFEVVDKYETKLGEHKARPMWQTLEALFKQGATKKRKSVDQICASIACEREELHKLLVSGGYLLIEEMYSILVNEIKVNSQSQVASEPTIIALLDKRAADCREDETVRVDVEIAEPNTSRFSQPGHENHVSNSRVDEDEEEGKRSARTGGWEVQNNTKFQFRIQTPYDCYLYVLTFERVLPGADVEMLFPVNANDRNKITRNVERKFPNPRFVKTDPQICKLENLDKNGTVIEVLVYVLLLSGHHTMQDAERKPDITYIEDCLGNEDSAQDAYIKRFGFEVAPSGVLDVNAILNALRAQ